MHAVPVLAAQIVQARMVAGEVLRRDNRGRPVMSVEVNGQGPFDMVVDTGAQTSLLSPSLARQLRLEPIDTDMRIEGATGSSAATAYPVDRLSNDMFDRRGVALLALPNPQTTSALGIIGMDAFTGVKLLFDRKTGRIAALPSSAPSAGFVALKGERRADGLLLVPLTINGVTINALVDTGSAVTIANDAARRAMGWSVDDPRLRSVGEIQGATAHRQGAQRADVDELRIGPALLHKVPIIFTPAAMNGGTPSIILGSDVLNLFDAYAIDLSRGELHIAVPAGRSRR